MLSQEKEKDSVITAKQGYVIPAKAGIHFFLKPDRRTGLSLPG